MYDEDAILLTPTGHKQLSDELERLTKSTRSEIAVRIQDSKSHGEFSEENSELEEIKFEQTIIEERIVELQEILASCYVLTPADISTKLVSIGTVVTLANLKKKKEELKVNVVSGAEADLHNDNVSDDSPLGRAIIGRAKGDQAKVEAPAGTVTYAIVKIGKLVK